MKKFVVFALFAALSVCGMLFADNDLSENGSVVIKKDTLVYKGKALKPAAKVYCGGNKPLKKRRIIRLPMKTTIKLALPERWRPAPENIPERRWGNSRSIRAR